MIRSPSISHRVPLQPHLKMYPYHHTRPSHDEASTPSNRNCSWRVFFAVFTGYIPSADSLEPIGKISVGHEPRWLGLLVIFIDITDSKNLIFGRPEQTQNRTCADLKQCLQDKRLQKSLIMVPRAWISSTKLCLMQEELRLLLIVWLLMTVASSDILRNGILITITGLYIMLID